MTPIALTHALTKVLAALVFTLCATTPLKAQFDPATLKGSNYMVNSAMTAGNALAFTSYQLGGTYSTTQVQSDLSQLANVGITNVRIWPSFYGWLVNRNDYMSNLDDFCLRCAQNGITVTYVVWNATAPQEHLYFITSLANSAAGPVGGNDPALGTQINWRITTAQLPWNAPNPTPQSFFNPWQGMLHSEPGNDMMRNTGDYTLWPNNLRQKIDNYLAAIGNFFATNPNGIAAYGSYDLFNEGDTFGIPLPNLFAFVATTHSLLSAAHVGPNAPTPHYTIGSAFTTNLAADYFTLLAMGVQQTYLSYHYYGTPADLQVVTSARLVDASIAGLPLVCSEFYDTRYHVGTFGQQATILRSAQVGGQMWGLFHSNALELSPAGIFRYVDGIVMPVINLGFPVPGWFTQPVAYPIRPASPLALVDYNAVIGW